MLRCHARVFMKTQNPLYVRILKQKKGNLVRRIVIIRGQILATVNQLRMNMISLIWIMSIWDLTFQISTIWKSTHKGGEWKPCVNMSLEGKSSLGFVGFGFYSYWHHFKCIGN